MTLTLEAVPSARTAEEKTEVSDFDAARALVRMAKERYAVSLANLGVRPRLTATPPSSQATMSPGLRTGTSWFRFSSWISGPNRRPFTRAAP